MRRRICQANVCARDFKVFRGIIGDANLPVYDAVGFGVDRGLFDFVREMVVHCHHSRTIAIARVAMGLLGAALAVAHDFFTHSFRRLQHQRMRANAANR